MATKPKGAVLLTGAATGIGQVTALHLDKQGYRVFAGTYPDPFEPDSVEILKQKASDQLTAVEIDITRAESIAAAVETVSAAVGEEGLCGLVNIAGMDVAGPLEFLPLDLLRRQFEVNVIGQLAMIQAFTPLLRKGKGRVVNFGSMQGRLILPLDGAYCSSKAALTALNDSLRMEYRLSGIPVTIVEPGFIGTNMMDKSIAEYDKLEPRLPQESRDRYGPSVDKVRKLTQNERVRNSGSPPEKVAKVVEKALKAKHPKRRYRVGSGGRIMPGLAKYMPEPALDWLIGVKMFGLREGADPTTR
jgi:NAD(P)-dependent dehydrogenase (short-subunit alcohol dehydrogenase family)